MTKKMEKKAEGQKVYKVMRKEGKQIKKKKLRLKMSQLYANFKKNVKAKHNSSNTDKCST